MITPLHRIRVRLNGFIMEVHAMRLSLISKQTGLMLRWGIPIYIRTLILACQSVSHAFFFPKLFFILNSNKLISWNLIQGILYMCSTFSIFSILTWGQTDGFFSEKKPGSKNSLNSLRNCHVTFGRWFVVSYRYAKRNRKLYCHPGAKWFENNSFQQRPTPLSKYAVDKSYIWKIIGSVL